MSLRKNNVSLKTKQNSGAVMSELQTYNKQYHFDNAKSLIKAGDNGSLRYACLELRMLIEAHVYQRLLLEIGQLPQSIINTWQPNKAVKLHAMFDKYADMDLCITLGEPNDELKITYNNIKSNDLSKIYNTLGGYLHLPTPQKIKSYDIDKEKIITIYDRLERILAGNIIIIKTEYKTFDCRQCGESVLYTDHYLESHHKISCQNEACELEYAINRSEENFKFSTDIQNFSCSTCASTILIPYKHIEDGHQFKCLTCDAGFRFELVVRTNTPP